MPTKQLALSHIGVGIAARRGDAIGQKWPQKKPMAVMKQKYGDEWYVAMKKAAGAGRTNFRAASRSPWERKCFMMAYSEIRRPRTFSDSDAGSRRPDGDWETLMTYLERQAARRMDKWRMNPWEFKCTIWPVHGRARSGRGRSLMGEPRITAKVLLQLLESQKYTCALTGRTLTPQNTTLDHKRPRRREDHTQSKTANWLSLR